MKILNKELLDQCTARHSETIKPLQRWVDLTEDARWQIHNDLKKDFPSADYVGNSRYVFNIKGNHYRIIAVVIFVAGLVAIRFVGTHGEYDHIDARTV